MRDEGTDNSPQRRRARRTLTAGTTSQPAAVLLGLDSMQGLQAARILARRGVPVIAVAGDPKHPCCRTRVCERVLYAKGGEEVLELLKSLGPSLSRKAVLVPCHDSHVLLVSRHRGTFERWYHVVLPEAEVVEMLMDKIRFYTYAQEQGLPIPPTFYLYDREDAERAAQRLRYPCILKPPYRSESWTRHTKQKAFKVHDKAEFLALYDHCHRWSEALVAQAWIAGGDANLYSCNCYFSAEAEPLVTFTARKLRQWPPETGQSCLGEEVRNEVVAHETLRLFRGVGYRGLGYVEIKRDEHTGEYFIIEPNIGRPTGRSAIAEAGGVELLYTMYCDALGRPLPGNRTQTFRGVKWTYLLRDLQSSLYYWRRGELSITEWWRSVRGPKVYAYFSWSDPLPFLGAIMKLGLLFIGRAAGRPASARQRGGRQNVTDHHVNNERDSCDDY